MTKYRILEINTVPETYYIIERFALKEKFSNGRGGVWEKGERWEMWDDGYTINKFSSIEEADKIVQRIENTGRKIIKTYD